MHALVCLLATALASSPALDPDLAAASKPPAPRPTDLVDAEGAPVSPEAFVARAQAAQVVLVGESHPLACDHEAQRRLIESLATAGLAPAVGLEMVAVDQAAVLTLFNERRLAADALERALLWRANWGHPFSLYRSIFDAAERWNLPVVALNVPPMAAFLAGHHGAASEDIHPRSVVPEPTILPSPQQLAELREVFEAHQGLAHGAPPDFERFAQVQAMWDSKMAEEALRSARALRRPIVVLAGAGHVEALGIPWRLHQLAPEVGVVTVLPWRGGALPTSGEADLFFYCPEKP